MSFESTVLPIVVLALILFGSIGGFAIVRAVEERYKGQVRKMYCDLVQRKLDVIQTALTMGYKDQDLQALDERLERLIGTEKLMATLQAGKEPPELASAELRDADLTREVDRQAAQRKEHSTER